MDVNVNHERAIDWANDRIADQPGRVVLVFLALTLVFGVGLGSVSTESGTQQFSRDVPANEALERINEEFGTHYAVDTGSTQLIQRERNVLSKRAMLSMLRAQKRIEGQSDMRVTGTSSAASVVATTLDPRATSLEDQIRAIERATPSQIDRAVRQNANSPRFTGTLSNDFNPTDASASATIGVVTHRIPTGLSDSAGQGGNSPLTPLQTRIQGIVATVDGDITVFGSGITSSEFSKVISDSLLLVTPAALIFILFFLVVAYRDLMDLLLGFVSLLMAIVWTFGALGLMGLSFNVIMISIPPLLLAVGIDFGIHAVNRYREAREAGDATDPGDVMRVATRQLLVAFFIVTGTTVIGFLSNFASDLPPIRDFGLTAAIGIVFTFLIFGIFLPAAKVLLDRLRDRYPIPTFSTTALGAEGSSLGTVLGAGVTIADRAPVALLLLALVVTGGAATYATGIDTSFSQEDFLPPEDIPDYLEDLPEPFRPSEYDVTATLNFLEDNFDAAQTSSVTVYHPGRMVEPLALERIHRVGEDPPSSFVTRDGRASETSIVTVIRSRATRDPEFRRLVARNDRNGNGIPDKNLRQVYDALMESSSRDRAVQYLARDYRSTRVVYSVESDAATDDIVADAQQIASRYRGSAIATGQVVVFDAISALILESALTSLAIALGLTIVFLVAIYWVIEGLPSLGIANAVPIVVSVAAIGGSMRLLGVPFNAITATLLAITIGLGVDYSVHVVHRFIDERREQPLTEALDRTVRGTGGALTGSMLTTVSGIGVLVIALLTPLGQFGVITGLSIFTSYLASLLVLPSTLVVWDRLVNAEPDVSMNDLETGTVASEPTD